MSPLLNLTVTLLLLSIWKWLHSVLSLGVRAACRVRLVVAYSESRISDCWKTNRFWWLEHRASWCRMEKVWLSHPPCCQMAEQMVHSRGSVPQRHPVLHQQHSLSNSVNSLLERIFSHKCAQSQVIQDNAPDVNLIMAGLNKWLPLFLIQHLSARSSKEGGWAGGQRSAVLTDPI